MIPQPMARGAPDVANLPAAGVCASMPAATFACGQIPCHKDEDRFYVKTDGVEGLCDVLVGVFDGHGGKDAADYCKEHVARILLEESAKNPSPASTVLPELAGVEMARPTGRKKGLAMGKRYSLLGDMGNAGVADESEEEGWTRQVDEVITKAFVRLDKEIKEKVTGGVAAVICLVKRVHGRTHVKCAWAGDSRAIIITNAGGFDLSYDHKPDEPEENRRVRTSIADIRRGSIAAAMEKLEVARNSAASGSSSPGRGAAAQGQPPTVPSPLGQPSGSSGVPGEPELISDFIDETTNGEYEVARVVNVTTGVSLACSRTIGDAGKSEAVIPDPDFKNATLEVGERARIILCSDGVWDVIDTNRCATECFFTFKETAADAAKHLAEHAKKSRMAKAATMGDDDITALVVDINSPDTVKAMAKLAPAGVGANEKDEDAGGGGCCTVM